MLEGFDIPTRPEPSAHRRFRLAVAIVLALVIVALVLQATPHALLPARKTSTLWGILVGAALMTAFVEWQWGRQSGPREG